MKLGLLHITRQNGTKEVHSAVEVWDGWHILSDKPPVIGSLPKHKVLKSWLEDGFIRKSGITEFQFVAEISHPMKVVKDYINLVRAEHGI